MHETLKILKVINNNVVSCVNSHNNELVVMGRGLGFGAKPGNQLSTENVEKVFRMDDMNSKEDFTKLKDLFSRLPADLLDVCNEIIDHANGILGHRLNESIYLTLTDHINFAIERSKQGMYLKNALLTEVRVFYPKEFAIGKYALEHIENKQGVKLPEDEAASVAMHLVNAEYDGSMSMTVKLTGVLQPMLEILENFEGIKLDKSHLYYDELMVHLKFAALEAFNNSDEKSWNNEQLIDVVKASFPKQFSCANKIAELLKEQCGNSLSQTEQAYLAICIGRACN